MNPLVTTTAAELVRLVAQGEVSAREVIDACLDRIEACEPEVNAFLAVDTERARVAAEKVDAQRQAGEPLGPLAGVPVAVKDLYAYRGLPTTCASRILQDWLPGYDSTAVTKVQAAGAIILGKTNLDEFAMGSSTETSFFGATHNPWNLTKVPGGSGGGSAAALAAFETPLALGTDTGGSIRQPASFTGTVGVKPTYGGISRYGIVGLASSLDTPGPCARTVLDAALLHEAMGGYDPLDATSIDAPVPSVVAAARRIDVRGMRIGVITELGGDGYAPGVEQRFQESLALLEGLGAEIVEVSCPHLEYAFGAYYLIMTSEVSSNLARFDGMRYGLRAGDDGQHSVDEVMGITRGQGFGAEVKRRIILGTYALSAGYYDAYYGAAQKVRTLLIRDFTAAFQNVDVVVSPSTPMTAFGLGEHIDDPLSMYKADLCTLPANLAGNCAISVPSGLSDDLPTGFQVMAPPMADDRLYLVAGALEAALADQWGGVLTDQLARREEGAR